MSANSRWDLIRDSKGLRMIYSHVKNNGKWRTRYNNELYTFYDELT